MKWYGLNYYVDYILFGKEEAKTNYTIEKWKRIIEVQRLSEKEKGVLNND